MENMVKDNIFGEIYKDRTIFITGHTGFKGSWLAHWLQRMGANVIGYSLEPPTIPNHYSLLNDNYTSVIGDMRNIDHLKNTIIKFEPEIIFHLAAQALVNHSYANPIHTYETNVLGTLNVYEACRNAKSVKAVVTITSDKCYDNKEWIWGYREIDSMGGYDPYSSSKGCAELLTASYRNSFFNNKDFGKKHNVLLASARAGNVIGGGDWADDRLIPDMARAISNNSKLLIRNPNATRPWQHVLEPLSGYLTLGWRLLEGKSEYAAAWNFGPEEGCNVQVKELIEIAGKFWPGIKHEISSKKEKLHEAHLLMLDCSKANKILKWKTVWEFNKTIKHTIDWYKAYYANGVIHTDKDISTYIDDAKEKNIIWTR